MWKVGDIRMNWPIVMSYNLLHKLSVAAFLRRAGGSMSARTGNHGLGWKVEYPTDNFILWSCPGKLACSIQQRWSWNQSTTQR